MKKRLPHPCPHCKEMMRQPWSQELTGIISLICMVCGYFESPKEKEIPERLPFKMIAPNEFQKK